jgi:5'-deoxynucleotidase YfbR-like HD superfamily hydrolase
MSLTKLRDQLDFVLDGAAVTRFHATTFVKPQTDGAHSFGVAWLCWLITGGAASKNLLLAALAHDLAEHRTGDVPSMTKRYATIGVQLEAMEAEWRGRAGLAFPLDEGETLVLDLADQLEGMCYSVAERRLGNQGAEAWYQRYRSYVWARTPLPGAAADLVKIMDAKMEAACGK